ncbi:hypothetical protein S7711_04928 [Stachybotrys chartarum IBT 7711]|uniref:Altered inheritance of mitochondria protein 21 n=1 Tax=Stachybotrys chartarum (strain CBS 109288 / IBT 7711) TaxID=1280523 RepID=A0A084AV16_STACB|nr:hypothetical protein S7711_04928 [Stachybotrys chartarum IBT 7711]KFA53158.1 hypothetical protein S40293_03130 [Stachybotrys chartarum IBT 40293]
MPAATMQQAPAIPPRPSRSADKDLSSGPVPKIPPRPIGKHLERSVSPNADRFAPSPLNEGIIAKSLKGSHLNPYFSHDGKAEDPIERAGSVNMPSVGEEGAEYSAVTEELDHEQKAASRAASPEQTRTVAHDLQLHAPKPSLPAKSAKQRVSAVTRTDSDKAASYGFGRSVEDRPIFYDSAKKRTSSVFSNGSEGQQTEDEHGIPEIGQRVPMNPNLGDVQAPSPGPGSENVGRRHHRKHSSRSLPPGSYGLHGHGVASQDKLDKAYYEKHPELLEREHHTPLHDRQNDFALSSSDLNKIVRDTASRASGMGVSADYKATPTDEAAFQATEEYASRISSPRPASTAPKATTSSHLSQTFKAEVIDSDDDTIHVEDSKHPECRSYGESGDAGAEHDDDYTAPILAADEVGKHTGGYLQQPAVHPGPERRGSAFEIEEPHSLPTSRPGSTQLIQTPREFDSTPLEDVKEYEPLFSEDAKQAREKQESPDESKIRRHFPSKDIWEDAPNSVHFTAEVSTPDVEEPTRRKSSTHAQMRPITPAQAFAMHQEELAEKEAKGPTHTFLSLSEDKPSWAAHQPHLKAERPSSARRFPSRDIWEDVPESHLHQATLSGSPPREESKPEIPARPSKTSDSSERPAIPDRPKPKQNLAEEASKSRPTVSDKPKPQLPARPTKSLSGDSKDGDAPKAKPPVPSRPVGGKIAALQAGFMSDLNKRLQIGPQAPKKEEPADEQEAAEEKEKVPLSDARKGRARGPQRRAPAKSPAPASSVETTKPAIPTFTFSTPLTTWTIHPEDGNVAVLEGGIEASPAQKSAEPIEQVQVPISEQSAQPEKVPESQETANVPETEPQDKVEEVQEQPVVDEPAVEEKTLVANTAGESILEEKVVKHDDEKEIEPVATSDEVKA